MVFASSYGKSGTFIARSAAMRRLLAGLAQVAPDPQTVWVRGETGTGKASLAKLIHEQSGRAGPFVHVFCGTYSSEQLKQLLFGAWRDSDSPSARPRRSLVEQAEGGTLLLDDINELPLELRSELMDTLSPSCRNGLAATCTPRVIATTSTTWHETSEEHGLTASWLDCGDICRVRIPPLRKRLDDLRPLTEHFLAQFRHLSNLPLDSPNRLTQEFWRRLFNHSWPGNVQELSNVAKQIMLFSPATAEMSPWSNASQK